MDHSALWLLDPTGLRLVQPSALQVEVFQPLGIGAFPALKTIAKGLKHYLIATELAPLIHQVILLKSLGRDQ